MVEFINFKAPSSEWGMIGMMRRIDDITSRFGPTIPSTAAAGGGEFQQLLQESSGQAPGIAKDESGTDSILFEPGTFPVEVPKEQKYSDVISKASEKYNLDKKLLEAVIKQESGFNPGAVSKKGAMGLMQLMPGTAKELGVDNPFDPVQNVDGGAKYLRSMLDRFNGNTEFALGAYNAGPKAVQTYKGVPPYDETKQYVKSIMNMLSEG